jgi:nucleoside-diphosphate-sugar epimerase
MTDRNAVAFGGAGFIGCHFLRRLAANGRYASLYSVDIAEPRFTDPGSIQDFLRSDDNELSA